VTDYTTLITSEHAQQPDFIATVDLTANGAGNIAATVDSLPALFDLDAAIGSQLDVDGQWIGLSRTVGGIPIALQFFGFSDDASALGFTELGQPSVGGRFVELGEDTTSSATLADPEYRLALRAKILQNQWDGSAQEFEAAIADIVTTPCQFFDPGDHVVTIVPSIALDPTLFQLLTAYDLMPRGAGVRYQYLQPLATPYAWSIAGTATASGTTVSKPTGTAAWDSSAYVQSPSNALYMSWTVPFAGFNAMGGFASNPSGSPNYPSLNFGLWNSDGSLIIEEAGIEIGTFGTYVAGDTLAVLWDQKEAVYFHNGKVIRVSKPSPSPGALSPMFCLYSVTGYEENVSIWTGN
jgi:hypothetical protein